MSITGRPASQRAGGPLVRPFPAPGPRVRLAYRELDLAETGSIDQRKVLGNPDQLPRPWDPATCTDPDLRAQLWEWLEAVVAWLNRDYCWDLVDMIPSCWPHHPHLVHEIAVLADQRRRAGGAIDSHDMEEWHRHTLPTFTDRMRGRLQANCDEGHQPWPGRGRHSQHVSDADAGARREVFAHDIDAVGPRRASGELPSDCHDSASSTSTPGGSVRECPGPHF